MIKDKRIRNILLYFIVVLACVFFIGFFTAKNAYAANNEIKSLSQIYEEYGVTSEVFRNPYDYGDNVLIIHRVNPSSDMLKIYVLSRPIEYNDFKFSSSGYNLYVNVPLLYEISYVKDGDTVRIYSEKVYDTPYSYGYTIYACCGSLEDGIESIRNQSPLRTIGSINTTHNIIYSSFHLKDSGGTVFFSATIPTILSPIMGEMKNQNQLQPLAPMVSLIPIGLGLVVSLVAFRKVWKVLRTVSYQA